MVRKTDTIRVGNRFTVTLIDIQKLAKSGPEPMPLTDLTDELADFVHQYRKELLRHLKEKGK